MSATRQYRVAAVGDLLQSFLAQPGQNAVASYPASSSSCGDKPAAPHSILVGRFKVKSQAEPLHPTHPPSRHPAAICFVDGTGAVPCEFSRFDKSWMDGLVCLVHWNLVTARWVTIGTGSKASNSANSAVKDRVDDPATPVHQFSGAEYDPIAECASLSSANEPELPTRRALLEQYKPITYLLGIAGTEIDSWEFAKISRPLLAKMSKSRSVSIHGRVRAKSVLAYSKDQSKVLFFIEMQCIAEYMAPHSSPAEDLVDFPPEALTTLRRPILTAFVLYNDDVASARDMLSYYESIRVGDTILFVNLKTTVLRTNEPSGLSGQAEAKKVLLFSFEQSKMFILDDLPAGSPIASTINAGPKPARTKSTALPSHSSNRASTTTINANPAPSSSSHLRPLQSRVISYSGRITKVVDVLFGIYELDSIHQLYLTFHAISGCGRGLRTGAVLDLHNVHVLIDETKKRPRAQQNGSRLNLEKRTQRVVFVACACSTVTMKEFSDDLDAPCLMCPAKGRAAVLQKWRAMNIPDLLSAARIREHLQRYLPSRSITDRSSGKAASTAKIQWTSASALRLLEPFGYTPYRMDIPPTLVNHDDACTLATRRYTPPDILSVADVVQNPCLAAFRGSDARGTKSTKGLASGGYSHRVFQLSDLGYATACLVVFLIGDKTGNLALVDATGSVLASVETSTGGLAVGTEELGKVWAIRRFEVVVEVLGQASGHPDAELLKKTYVRFSFDDAFCVEGVADTGQEGSTGTISSSPQKGLLFALNHLGLPAIRFTGRPHPHIFAHAQGWSWPIAYSGTKTAMRAKLLAPPRKTYIQFAEEQTSLLPTLRIEEKYVISGGAEDTSEDAELALQFKEGMQLEHITVSIADTAPGPPPATNRILPRIFHISSQKSRSYFSAPPSVQQPPTIHSVSSLVETFPSIRTRTRPGNFHDRLVSVRGIVHAKEFRDVDPWNLDVRVSPTRLLSKYNVGVGRFDRMLFVRLRDAGVGGETMDVYMDLRQCGFPLGLLVGCGVVFRRLGLKVSGKGTVYGQFVAETHVEVVDGREMMAVGAGTGVAGERGPVLQGRWGRLADLHDGRPGLHRVRCTVTHVQEVVIWYECGSCGFMMHEDAKCTNGCPQDSKEPVFRAKGKCFVEDGTAEAVMMTEDVDVVLGLLTWGGNPGIERALKRWAQRAGEIKFKEDPPWFVEQVDNESGEDTEFAASSDVAEARRVLASACRDRNVCRAAIIVCRNSDWRRKDEPKDAISTDPPVPPTSLRHRTFKANEGQSFPTVAFPKLIINAVGWEELDVKGETMRLLGILGKKLDRKGKGRVM